MQEVQPFQTLDDATEVLDNGGRFYHLLAREDDGRIDTSELNTAAGVFLSEQKAFLYLQLALADLRPLDRDDLLAKLAPATAKRFRERGPAVKPSSAIVAGSKPGSLAVAEGTPRYESHQTRRIIVMIPAGKVMVPVPVTEHYDCYRLVDPADRGEPATMIVPKPTQRLPERRMRVAGAVRSITFDDPGGRVPGAVFEPLYFTMLE